MRRLLSVLVLLLGLLPSQALADDEATAKLTPAEREQALKQADELNKRILALYGKGEYAEALAAARQQVAVLEKALGPKSERVGSGLSTVALLLQMQGQYKEARSTFEQALGILQAALGEAHPEVATCLNNLGALLYEIGEYERSRAFLEQGLSIRERALGPEHASTAGSLSNVATILDALGRYEAQEPLLQRALAIYEKTLGDKHPNIAATLNNLARLRTRQGRYADARRHYEAALAIDEAAYGFDHPEVATDLNNLAALLEDLGQYRSAQALAERALKIRETRLGPEHPYVAESLNLLGALHADQGRLEDARRIQTRALTLRKRSLGEDHPALATTLVNLGYLASLEGQHAEAKRLFEEALAIRKKAFGEEHPVMAVALNNLAWAYEASGDLDAATKLYERAQKLREQVLGSNHLQIALGLSNLGAVRLAGKDYAGAEAYYIRALAIDENQIRDGFVGLPAPERRRLGRALRWHLHGFVRASQGLGKDGYEAVLRFKGLIARARSAEWRSLLGGTKETVAAVEDLLALERKLAGLVHSAPPFFKREERKRWQGAYAQTAAARESKARSLAGVLGSYRAGLDAGSASVAAVVARLDPAEVLVDVLRSGEHYLAWVVKADETIVALDLGKATEIEKAATAFAQGATAFGDESWRPAGQRLRDLIVRPVEAHLGKGVRRLIISPDAALAAVPYGALPGREKGRLLLDDYDLVTVSMAQDLLPRSAAAHPGKGAVLLGGVDYGRGGRFTRLPETRAEVQSVRARVGAAVVVLQGADATEARLRQAARGARLIHLATHGFVRDDFMAGLRRRGGAWLGAGRERQLAQGYDPMLLAGLALAGANARAGGHGDDGILTALEASHLELAGVDLVVLSACQTALGKAESGEGVIGLVRGFQSAGARRVIGSLWRVDDEATRALMVKFYDLYASEGNAAAALRQAQAFVRGHDKWKHPYYWAAWVLWTAG